MILKLGSKGEDVRILQECLNLKVDGDFGKITEKAVKEFQTKLGLKPDGIVGDFTWSKLGMATTDISEKGFTTESGLVITKRYLSQGEYLDGPIKPEWLFLHHTAGWHNPYGVIDQWNGDTRGPIGTEFVIGGQSIKGNDHKFDGEIVQAFPHGNWGYHLGVNGSQTMHKNSIGVEVCNFGYLINGKTYSGSTVEPSEIVTLTNPFRGYKTWHRYSDKQLFALKDLIYFIGKRDGIDIRKGLPSLIRTKGAEAFDFNVDAYYGRVKGVWTHTNTRKDKTDMFPQQELMDMLVSL